MVNEKYYIAEGGRPKLILDAWREEQIAAERNLADYMTEIGATGAFRFGLEKPGAFKFPRDEAPEGWTKPGRNGASRPKKSNAAARERLEAMPWPASLDELLPAELGLARGMEYGEIGTGRFGSSVMTRGRISTFSACWTTAPDGGLADVILMAPDYAAQEASFRKRAGDDMRWTPEGTGPDIPEGFREMTEAEVDLMFAEAKVAREAAQRAEADTPADDANVEADPYDRTDLVEAYGYRVDPRSVFERDAPEALQERAADNAIGDGGYSWVLWDPADGDDGFLITSDNEGALRSEFEDHARGSFLPPRSEAEEDAVPEVG